MKLIDIVGLCAGAITSFALLPQVIKTIRTRDTQSLSFSMFLLFILGVTLWLIYGISLHNFPMIAANVLTLIFACIILFYKIKELITRRPPSKTATSL